MTQDVSNEPRDAKGKWTVGASGGDNHAHPAGPFMAVSNPANAAQADRVATIAAGVAAKMGFDPLLINVSDESKTFELNGQTLNYAGAAHRPPEPGKHTDTDVKGTITLYTPHIGEYTTQIEGTTAHEIMHQKWNAFNNDVRRDSLKMQEDPEYHKDGAYTTDPSENGGKPYFDRKQAFMRPDGLLNDPHASKYPAYQAYTKAMMPGTEEFSKSDGVSDYSREYWKGYVNRTLGSDKAYHETLAEIGRLRYQGMPVYHAKLSEVDGKPVYFSQGAKGIKPVWNALYKAVEDNWKRRTK